MLAEGLQVRDSRLRGAWLAAHAKTTALSDCAAGPLKS